MKFVSLVLALVWSVSLLGEDTSGDLLENLTTGDANVSVYRAKDGSNDWVMHFTNTTDAMTFTVNRTCRVRLLAVGGGGAGGFTRGGGGGAGGLILNDSYKLEPGTYTVNVGAGGTRMTANQPDSTTAPALGKATTLAVNGATILTAAGGGFGGYRASGSSFTTGTTLKGGSAGGVGAGCKTLGAAVKSLDGSLVNVGGLSQPDSTSLAKWREMTNLPDTPGAGDNAAGGGGGAGSAGRCGMNGAGGSFPKTGTREYGIRKFGDGGAGKESDITGEVLFYAAGGGGGGFYAQNGGLRGLGGSGIGGHGAGFIKTEDIDAEFAPATSGLDGTGSGGGGVSISDNSASRVWYRLNGEYCQSQGDRKLVVYEDDTKKKTVKTYSGADFYSGAGGSGALILRWTPYDPEEAKRPSLAVDACADNGDTTATAELEVVSLGEGGTSATVTLRWGLEESDLSMGTATTTEPVTATGEMALTLTGLLPGHTYYYQATIANDAGKMNSTPVRSFAVDPNSMWPQVLPEGMPVIGSCTIAQTGAKGLDLRVSGVLKQDVAGTRAKLYYAYDETAARETMSCVEIADLGLGEDEAFAFTVDGVLRDGQTFYGYLELSATSGGVTREDLSGKLSLKPVTAAWLGHVNSNAKDYGAGYSSGDMSEKIAILFTPGYGDNVAKIYLIPGTEPWNTRFDEEKAVLVKTVEHAEYYRDATSGAFKYTLRKVECPREIAWDVPYYYWVVMECGDPEDPYVTHPTVNGTSVENGFTFVDMRGGSDVDRGEITTDDYIQDGLIAQWDGVENAGVGKFNSTPSKWYDLKRDARLSVRAGEYFADGMFVLTNSAQTSTDDLFDGRLTEATLESYSAPVAPMSTNTDWYCQMARIDTVGLIGYDGRLGGISAAYFPSDDVDKTRLRTFDSGYETAADILAAGVVQTYSARLGPGACRVSVNGEVRERTEGVPRTKEDFSRSASSTSKISVGGGSTRMKIGSLRVYSRQISDAEAFHNHKIDLARFASDTEWVRRVDGKLRYHIRITCDARLGTVSVNGGEPQGGVVDLWVDEDGPDTTVELTTTSRVREFRGWKGAHVSDADALATTISLKPMIMDVEPLFWSGKTHYIPTDYIDINTAVAAEDVLDGDTLFLEDGRHVFDQTFATNRINGSNGTYAQKALYHCGILKRPLNLTGSSPENVVLDCNGAGGLYIENADALVSNLSITNFTTAVVDARALVLQSGTVSNIVINGMLADDMHENGSCAVSVGPEALVTDSVIKDVLSNYDWSSHHLMQVTGATFRRVTFSGNRCSHMISCYVGNTGLRNRFENCLWTGNRCKNTTTTVGGQEVDLVGCVFSGNVGTFNGSLFSPNNVWTMTDCVITNTTVTDAGAIFGAVNGGASLYITNSLIANNSSKTYGVFRLGKNSRVELVNTTVAHNATTLAATVADANNPSKPVCAVFNGDGKLDDKGKVMPMAIKLVNSILWNNTAGGVVKQLNDSYEYTTFESSHCCLSPGTPLEGEDLTFGDPDFISPEEGDFHLGHGSSCIDVGAVSPEVLTDLDGKTRPVDGMGDGYAGWDIGCYEADEPSDPIKTAVTMSQEEGLAPSSVNLTVTVTGSSLSDLTYEWWWVRDAGGEVTTNVVSGVTPDFSFADLQSGRYTFVSVVGNGQGDAVTNQTEKTFLSLTDTAYVSTTGSGVWPYDTPETAARTLEEAIPVARRVRVLPGTYAFGHRTDETTGRECQALVSRGAVIEGSEDPETVVIDCAGRGGFILDHPNASLCGMTFINAQTEADSGSALDVQAGSVSNIVIRGTGEDAPSRPIPYLYLGENASADRIVVSNCVVKSKADNMGLVSLCGGILRDFSLTDCVSTNTLVFSTKATSGTRSRIERGLVANNIHSGSGVRLQFTDATQLDLCDNLGGVRKTASTLVLYGGSAERCRVLRNVCSAAVYSAVLWGNDMSSLVNSLVMDNETKNRAAVDSTDGSSRIIVENCTIVFNAAESGPAGGVACNVSSEHSTHLNMVNSIVWGNTVAGEPNDAGEVRETCNYSTSCFREAASYPGANNLSADPILNPSNGKLTSKSPCIDAGADRPWHAEGVDLDGNRRVRGKGVDLGCYEFCGNPLVIIFR